MRIESYCLSAWQGLLFAGRDASLLDAEGGLAGERSAAAREEALEIVFEESGKKVGIIKVVAKMHNPWNSSCLFNHKTQREITVAYRTNP